MFRATMFAGARACVEDDSYPKIGIRPLFIPQQSWRPRRRWPEREGRIHEPLYSPGYPVKIMASAATSETNHPPCECLEIRRRIIEQFLTFRNLI
jgi:hypothetical protein